MIPPFTLSAIGARIAWCCQDEAEREPKVDHGSEKLALTDLAFLTPAADLGEAAVLCDLAFGAVDALIGSELTADQTLRVAGQLRRALVAVGMAVCRAAELDPDTVAWGELRTGYAREFGRGAA